MLKDDSEDSGQLAGYATKEHATTNIRPYLEITYTPSATSTPLASVSYASQSFSDVEISDRIIKGSLGFFVIGFVIAIWYFRKYNRQL